MARDMREALLQAGVITKKKLEQQDEAKKQNEKNLKKLKFIRTWLAYNRLKTESTIIRWILKNNLPAEYKSLCVFCGKRLTPGITIILDDITLRDSNLRPKKEKALGFLIEILRDKFQEITPPKICKDCFRALR